MFIQHTYNYIHTDTMHTRSIDGLEWSVCVGTDRCNFVSRAFDRNTHLFNAAAADDGCCFYLFPWLRSYSHTHDSFATALVVNQHDSLLCMPLCIYDNCAFQIKFDPDFTVSATKKCKRIEETQLRSVFKGERETLGEVDNTTSRPSHKYPYTICKICKCKLIIGI